MLNAFARIRRFCQELVVAPPPIQLTGQWTETERSKVLDEMFLNLRPMPLASGHPFMDQAPPFWDMGEERFNLWMTFSALIQKGTAAEISERWPEIREYFYVNATLPPTPDVAAVSEVQH